MDLCNYSNILGTPGMGIHSYKILNISIVDVILTLIGAYILKYCVNRWFETDIHYITYVVILLIISVILHRMFCVRSTVDKLLFAE